MTAARKPRQGAQPISKEAIRALATAESFARGRSYFDDGAVSDLCRRGDRLTAEVEGSEFEPYQVSIRLHDGGVADAHCTCPYDWGGYCKHIVAVLLKFADAKTRIVERKPLAELLAGLDQTRLIELLEKRAESDPELATWIEAELATAMPTPSPQRPDGSRRRTAVNSAPVREQARALLAARNRRGRYWDDYRSSGDIEELQRLVQKAVPFLEVGDGVNALRILEPIAEAFVEDWLEHTYESDEHLYELFTDLGRLFAEAALMSDLAADERDALAETLEDWQGRLEEYGVDEGFHVAIRALRTGCDDPALAAVMAGEGKSWPPSGADDWLESELTAVRLRVLEAGGRTEEYLNLARAAPSSVEIQPRFTASSTRGFTPAEHFDDSTRFLGRPGMASIASRIVPRVTIADLIAICFPTPTKSVRDTSHHKTSRCMNPYAQLLII